MTTPPPRETSKDKLLQIIGRQGAHATNASDFERAKAELLTYCAEDLIKSIDDNSASSNSLATKVYYLSIVLTVATVIGAIVAVFSLFCSK